MPPKGFKKPEQTRCATCQKILPHLALRGVMSQLADVKKLVCAPKPEGWDAARHARLQLMAASVHLDIMLEDEASFCFGHGAKKPGRKPREESADPSTPPGVEPAKKRRKLRAVQTGGGDG